MAQELIDWLIAHKEVPDRETAVQLMQYLMDHDIIHHGRTLFTVHQITEYDTARSFLLSVLSHRTHLFDSLCLN